MIRMWFGSGLAVFWSDLGHVVAWNLRSPRADPRIAVKNEIVWMHLSNVIKYCRSPMRRMIFRGERKAAPVRGFRVDSPKLWKQGRRLRSRSFLAKVTFVRSREGSINWTSCKYSYVQNEMKQCILQSRVKTGSMFAKAINRNIFDMISLCTWLLSFRKFQTLSLSACLLLGLSFFLYKLYYTTCCHLYSGSFELDAWKRIRCTGCRFGRYKTTRMAHRRSPRNCVRISVQWRKLQAWFTNSEGLAFKTRRDASVGTCFHMTYIVVFHNRCTGLSIWISKRKRFWRITKRT